MICPYCNNTAHQVTGKEIYPHRPDLYVKIFYQCKPCDAYVGCHNNTNKALGRLANAGLRSAKSQAHTAFDPIWRDGNKTRSAAYRWLASQLNITTEQCHIGMFDLDKCRAVITVSNEYQLTH